MNITLGVGFKTDSGIVENKDRTEILRVKSLLLQFLADNEIIFDHSVEVLVTINE